MDSNAANIASSSFASATSPFEVPIAHQASPSLTALLAPDVADAVDSLEGQLLKSRLGVASSLFRALRLKHPPTAKHSIRVALGCSIFADHLGLDVKTREQVEISALLHDIGKIGIPDQLLNKADRLDTSEYEVMVQHVPFAIHILESFCDDQTIIDNVQYAGHWYDGSRPYGSSIGGDSIPLGARLIAIQNAFDAMTTDTVYRQALNRERAISELFENTPTQFDPKLVAAFCEVHRGETAQHQTDFVRRWVEDSNEGADILWSFGKTVNQVTTDAQTIFQQRLLESMHDGVLFIDASARIMVWNRGAEYLTGLSKESIHHKLWQPQIIDLRDMEGNAIKTETCPCLTCLQLMQGTTHRMTITNRGKKSRVAVNVHTMPVRDATGLCHGAIMILHDISPEHTLEEEVQTLHTRATRDALTGVGNRAEFDKRLEELVKSHAESGEPLGLVICDIDRFKAVNDTYGHLAGDAALVDFASLIDRHSRGNDLVARYGGEEFVMLCPGCSGASAVNKAEEIRRSLACRPQPALRNSKMTASFGVTELQAGDTPESILERADQALYRAKSDGRNRVVQLGKGVEKRDWRRSSWFRWGTRKETILLKCMLKCSVPADLVAEKIRGFVSDNHAEVVSAENGSLVLSLDDRALPSQRRKSDRPFAVSAEFDLKPSPEGGTFIDLTIKGKRGRDRRQELDTERAQVIVRSLRGYLVAEEC